MHSNLYRVLCRLLVFAAVGIAFEPLASKALPEADVSKKLDSILMLMVVDAQGNPNPTLATVNGKSTTTYLAAMSVAAAEELVAGNRYELKKEDASTLRFSPVSLAKFYQLLEPLLQKYPARVGVVVPDPAQVDSAQKFLLAQNVPVAKAKEIAELQAMIFCPDPGLLVSINDKSEKSEQFVPCSTEANFVETIVQRAIKENPRLIKDKPRVTAIPLISFVDYLRKESVERAGKVRVIPNSRLVELVQSLNKQKQNSSPEPPVKQ
jgi:hypothetical protein